MATNYCPECGEAVSTEDRFCPACGATLAAAESAPEPGARPASQIPIVVVILAAIGLLLIAGGLLLNDNDAPQAAVEPTTVPESVQTDEQLPFPDIPRIALNEAASRQMAGDAIFVDVRDAEDYAEAHIPGALSVPLGDTELDPAYQELPEDTEIITYCT